MPGPLPARSARRCVPPIAGVRPTTVSTSPKEADSAARIRSQASASSNAHVRQSRARRTPSGTAAGRRAGRARSARRTARAACAEPSRAANTETSTPPENDAPLGPEQDRAGRFGLELADGGFETRAQLVVEQVERRRVERDDREPAVPLEPDGQARSPQRRGRRPRCSSASPSPGSHGSLSGSPS